MQISGGIIEDGKNKLFFSAANTCKEYDVVKSTNVEFVNNNNLRLAIGLEKRGSLFRGVKYISNCVQPYVPVEEICFNFVGIGDYDMAGIDEKYAENNNFIKKFLDGTEIDFGSLPKNFGLEDYNENVSLTVLIDNTSQLDKTCHKGSNEINIIKNMAKVLHNDLSPETKDKIKNFSKRINDKFKGLKINDVITVSDEARKSDAYQKGDGLDFNAGEGKNTRMYLIYTRSVLRRTQAKHISMTAFVC